METCALYNPDDTAGEEGPGPRFVVESTTNPIDDDAVTLDVDALYTSSHSFVTIASRTW